MSNTCVKVVVMYDYGYFSKHEQKNVEIKVGEVYDLISKSSDNWWFVRDKANPQRKLYVPASYVQERKTDEEKEPSKEVLEKSKNRSKESISRKPAPIPMPKSAKVLERMTSFTSPSTSAPESAIIGTVAAPEAFKGVSEN